jgi:hypothetical protein
MMCDEIEKLMDLVDDLHDDFDGLLSDNSLPTEQHLTIMSLMAALSSLKDLTTYYAERFCDVNLRKD